MRWVERISPVSRSMTVTVVVSAMARADYPSWHRLGAILNGRSPSIGHCGQRRTRRPSCAPHLPQRGGARQRADVSWWTSSTARRSANKAARTPGSTGPNAVSTCRSTGTYRSAARLCARSPFGVRVIR